ncbi:MAG: CBS domain-containing protein [Gammaproteobacteria bacterium]|nr:CBS domain-containing protein [Gammaproteobacteria bacterium]
MPVLELSKTIKAAPDLTWQVISDMSNFERVADNLVRADVIINPGENLKRSLFDKQGRGWDEERIALEEGRSLTMRVNSHSFSSAFSNMTYTWSIQPQADAMRISMRYEYSVRWGILGNALDGVRFRPKLRISCQQILDSWCRIINAREWAWRVTAEQIIERKGAAVITVAETAAVNEAVALLAEHNIGCLPVLNAAASLVGLVSERDIVRVTASAGADTLAMPVSEIMTRNLLLANPDDSMEVVMKCMNDHRIRHLPVVTDQQLFGLISIGDVVNSRIAELEGESSQLRDFIETRRFNELYRHLGPAAYIQDSDK